MTNYSDPRGKGWRPADNDRNHRVNNGGSPSPDDNIYRNMSDDTGKSPKRKNKKGLIAFLRLLFIISACLTFFSIAGAISEATGSPLSFSLFFLIISIVLLLIIRRIKQKNPDYAILGYVKSIKERSEKKGINENITVMTFHVERFDLHGNRISPIPVEMKGMSFSGSINEGDHIGINSKFREGRILQVSKLYNLTNNSFVFTRGTTMPFYLRIANSMGWILWFIIMSGIFALIIALLSNIS